MAVINVTSGDQAILTLGNTSALATPGASNGMVVPFVQDITINVALNGLLPTSINKTEVFFSVAVTGTGTTGDINISGKGFIGGLAPSASVDGAVWLSPMEIIVNGELTKNVEA
jgi:hypothetical protein